MKHERRLRGLTLMAMRPTIAGILREPVPFANSVFECVIDDP